MAGTWTSDTHSQRQPHGMTVRTWQTVRSLILRGFDHGEAANLTAFLCGIPVADRSWTLSEINGLLFLRELNRRGQFDTADGGRAEGAPDLA